jgi:hypothetical protein
MVGQLIVLNVLPVDILVMQLQLVNACIVQVDGKFLWCFVFLFLFFFVLTAVVKAIEVTRLLLFRHKLTSCVIIISGTKNHIHKVRVKLACQVNAKLV